MSETKTFKGGGPEVRVRNRKETVRQAGSQSPFLFVLLGHPTSHDQLFYVLSLPSSNPMPALKEGTSLSTLTLSTKTE